MDGRVTVVLYVACCCSVDCVVAPSQGILAGVPDGATLFEDDVARDDELVYMK